MIALRDQVRKLIDAQLDEHGYGESEQLQQELNTLYDSFSARYGLINDRANRLAFSSDSSYYLLCSLEILDDDHKLLRKADIESLRRSGCPSTRERSAFRPTPMTAIAAIWIGIFCRTSETG